MNCHEIEKQWNEAKYTHNYEIMEKLEPLTFRCSKIVRKTPEKNDMNNECASIISLFPEIQKNLPSILTQNCEN